MKIFEVFQGSGGGVVGGWLGGGWGVMGGAWGRPGASYFYDFSMVFGVPRGYPGGVPHRSYPL